MKRLRVLVLHNRDWGKDAPDAADVENAAAQVTAALVERGHQAERLSVSGHSSADLSRTLADLERKKPDLVFNLCESLGGDARNEAVLPALFELFHLPYTGSGPLGLGCALDKLRCKALLRAAGVPTPEAFVVDGDTPPKSIAFPLIVKLSREDASIGISSKSVVHDRRSLMSRVRALRAEYDQPIMAERYIEGRELYVTLVGNRDPHTFPMHEIDFRDLPRAHPRIVTYEGKWVDGSKGWKGTTPVRAEGIDARTRQRCAEVAKAAFVALDLRDYARVDLRLEKDGTPYVIDVNPNCDLSNGAGVSRAASYGGVAYAELIERICLIATERQRDRQKDRQTNRINKKSQGERNGNAARNLETAAARAAAKSSARSQSATGGVARSSRAPRLGRPGRALHQRGDLGRPRAH